MSAFREKYGPLALIAGASEGLGAAWAEALAQRGLDLILVARRAEMLEDLRRQLKSKYKINVSFIVCDLSNSNASPFILNEIGDRTINFFVYNAAASYIGPFETPSLATHENIVAVNINCLLQLIHALSPSMLAEGRGGIILLSSLAGFQGSGFLSTYGATKAFIRILAEGLWYEWKDRGVDIIACCAGAIATPNYLKTNPSKMPFFAPKPQQPMKVVEECLARIGKMPSFISGRANRWIYFLMLRVFTRKMAVKIMGDSTRKIYRI
ncbi:MAG TPA: SDR family NAD(P)-dependent oxidoreductase [Puia sp.]|nr:SDR family NAD(P)-dependent oxidoreductase [Puia sp.]